MAVRGPAAARRRLARRVAAIAGVAGFVVGALVAVLGGADAGGAVATGILLGLVAAVVGWGVVALLPTSNHGPRGQH